MTTPRTQQIFPLVAFFLFTACSSPSNGNDTPHADSRANEATSTNVSAAQERVLDFEDFTRVSVEAAMHVDIQQADAFHVDVTGSDEALEELKIEQEDDQLRFFFDRGFLDRLGREEDYELKISIRMPELIGLTLSGASEGTVQMDTPAAPFEADLSGASQLEGAVVARSMSLDVSGASNITLSGETSSLELDGSGASNLDLSKLSAGDVEVDLSGASNADIVTDGMINGDLSGASNLTYSGSPRLGNIETSGGSDLSQAE